jgi:diadenosine tetraphosphate (Ap4A) HIT family hydrolase
MAQATACIFCAIVGGTAPCLAVYEDEDSWPLWTIVP